MTTSGLLPFGFVEKNKRDSSSAVRENYNFSSGEATATVVYEGPWDKRQDFINNYIAKEIFDNNGTLITTKPAEYPHDPRLVAQSVTLKGMGIGIEDAQGITQYQRAELTVTFSTRNFSQDDSNDPQNDYAKGVYIREESDSKLEISTHMGHTMNYSMAPQNNAHEEQLFTIPWILADLLITQEHVLNPRWMEINFLHGKVNDRPFISPAGRPFRAGTLRYDGLQASTKIDIRNIQPNVNTTIKPRWELKHRFSYNNRRWDTKPVAQANVGQKFGFARVQFNNGDPIVGFCDLFWLFFGFGPSFNSNILQIIEANLIAIQNNFDNNPNGLPNIVLQNVANRAFDIRQQLLILGFNV